MLSLKKLFWMTHIVARRLWLLKLGTVLCFICTPAKATSSACLDLFRENAINSGQFESSAFGLIHAKRPGDARYSEWSAKTANEVLVKIRDGKKPSELFQVGIKARQDFARRYEGIENPEQDFGSPRIARSRFDVGEDMLGVSSINLALKKARALPSDFEAFPNPWWKNIASHKSRSQLADQVMQQLREGQKHFSTFDYDVLITDRHYLASTGSVLKASSTKIERASPGREDSPYFVSTLNSPKPEIDLLMNDVYRRISLALATKNKNVAREHLGHAMYGFFNAMPYYRGSAAIGRIVFTALFTHVEGKPVTIHPEVDVKALVQLQHAFSANLDVLVQVQN